METFIRLCCVWHVGNEVDQDEYIEDECVYTNYNNIEREQINPKLIIYDDYIQTNWITSPHPMNKYLVSSYVSTLQNILLQYHTINLWFFTIQSILESNNPQHFTIWTICNPNYPQQSTVWTIHKSEQIQFPLHSVRHLYKMQP